MGNSRPLSEHLLFLYVMKALGDKFVEPFSSPIGESTFSTFLDEYVKRDPVFGFRPLSGNLLSLLTVLAMDTNTCEPFSSPIGESTFSTV